MTSALEEEPARSAQHTLWQKLIGYANEPEHVYVIAFDCPQGETPGVGAMVEEQARHGDVFIIEDCYLHAHVVEVRHVDAML